MKKLIIFDFDGTITKRDSMLELTRFHRGNIPYFLGLIYLSPILLLYKMRWISNWKAKQFFLTYFWGGIPKEEFQSICEKFTLKKLPAILRPGAIEALETFKENHDQLVVISASAEDWLKPWAEKNGIFVIGSQLAVRNGRITGKLEGKNCYGPEKVKRLKKVFDLADYTEIIVYGDSKGDNELFDLATTVHYKPFRN